MYEPHRNITVRIVNAESNKLKKPVGYHQDLLVVSLLAAGCSVVGFPWLVAATVLLRGAEDAAT